MHRTTPRRLFAFLTACCLLLSAGFVWGFFSHRERLFPFSWLRMAAIRLGALRGDVGVAWKAAGGVPSSLVASPYLAGTVDPNAKAHGVIAVNHGAAMPGSTLVLSRHRNIPTALLIGLDGRLEWSWPLPGVTQPHVAQLLPEGDLLVVDAGTALVRVDRLGKVRWRVPGAFHHAVSVTDDHILTLRTLRRIEPRVHPRARVLDDELVTLDLAGNELSKVSLLDVLLASPQAFLITAPTDRELEALSPGRDLAELELDLLHTNHVSATGGAAAAIEALRSPGNYLISVRNLHLLAVLDGQTHAMLWAWGPGRLTQQHHPTLLPSGRLLVFNNGTSRSEVLEVDPAARRVEWSYTADGFFTEFGGSAQRLANGNTLITESMTGYVFEVTPAGQTVWVWANPDISPRGLRHSIYRATRHTPTEIGWLSSN